jgi:hypothetical protein
MRKICALTAAALLMTSPIVSANDLFIGSGEGDSDQATWEIRSDSGALVSSGALSVPRSNFAAVKLDNGNIFVAGGDADDTSWQILNESAGVVSSGTLQNPCISCAATAVMKGEYVFLAGGDADSSGWEVYSDVGGLVASGTMANSRTSGVAAVTFQSNKDVWVSGSGGGGGIGSWETYEMNGTVVTRTGSGSLANQRDGAKTLVLSDDNVLLLGGNVDGTYEIHSPAGALVTSGTIPGDPRDENSGAIMLANGNIFVFGGALAAGTWEILTQSVTEVSSGTLAEDRSGATVTLQSSTGDIFIGGGAFDAGGWEIRNESGALVSTGSFVDPRAPGHRQVNF